MKFSSFILVALCAFLFLAVPMVAAERYVAYQWLNSVINDNGTITRTNVPVNGVDIFGYRCTDAACSSTAGALWSNPLSTGSNNSIVLTYPTNEPANDYALFFTKEGFIPYEQRANFYGTESGESVQNPNGPYTFYLSRKASCTADLTSLHATVENGVMNFFVSVQAPFATPSLDPALVTPASVAAHYTSDVQLDVSVQKQAAVYAESESLSLDPSQSHESSFSLPVTPGTYQITAQSTVPDAKCLSSKTDSLSIAVVVTNTTLNESIPTVTIVSPQPLIYSGNSVRVELSATNSNDIWYNWNGSNVAYTGATNVVFPAGTHILQAFARNSAGIGQAAVTFIIDPTLNDTTAPGSVRNLVLQAKGSNFITWNWTNPTDADFHQAIIYLDGVNVANTSNSFFSAGNLVPGSTHTIRIHTKDARGNVNRTNVENTQTTFGGNGTDTTAPGAISHLHVTSRGSSFIEWAWTNPVDTDFAHALLFLDGVSVGSTSGSSYRATALAENRQYRLCVSTQDLAGNTNPSHVCLSARTRTDDDSDSDDDGDDRPAGRLPTLYPVNNSINYAVYEDEPTTTHLRPAVVKASIPLATLLLLIGVMLILVLILVVMLSRTSDDE